MCIPSWPQCTSNGYFQHDNPPSRKAKVVSSWLNEHDNEFNALQWPSQSLDVSPTEHLWDVVEREICSTDM